jgi:hypothetical protein
MIVMEILPSSQPWGNIRKGDDDFRLVLMSLVFYLRLIIALSEKHKTSTMMITRTRQQQRL